MLRTRHPFFCLGLLAVCAPWLCQPATAGDDLFVNFGSIGLWGYYNNANWVKLHATSPDQIAAGDLDGNGKNDLLVDFGSSGLWIRNEQWTKIHNASPLLLAAGDLDNSSTDEAIASFAGTGLFARHSNTSTWTRLTTLQPTVLAVGDLDGGGRQDVIGDFGASGILVYYNNGNWTKLHNGPAQDLETGDLDGNGKAEILVDFGASGLWVRLNNSSWTKLHNSSPIHIATGDLDNNGKDDAIIDFNASGIWVRYNNATWAKIHDGTTSQGIEAGDLDGNGKDDVVVDFGASGLWAFFNNASWSKLHSSTTAQALAVGQSGSPAWPNSTNTGYKNAPGYPGYLADFTGSLQSGQTYRFMNFPRGLSIPQSISDVTFYGCRFASNSLQDANVSVYGRNITFDYSSFEPSAASAPPVAYNKGYQYGIDKRRPGRMTVDHSDFWGWGNGIQFGSSSQSEPLIVRNSYFHHARQDGGIDHTDAILENYGGQSHMVFDNNTIVSIGNTNGLALQGNSYHHVTITNNYFSGFGYTVNMCGNFSSCNNIIFTDNTFGTDIRPDWGPLYGWSNNTNNLWRRNKWRVVPGSYYTNIADDGKFWWPNGALSTVDYNR